MFFLLGTLLTTASVEAVYRASEALGLSMMDYTSASYLLKLNGFSTFRTDSEPKSQEYQSVDAIDAFEYSTLGLYGGVGEDLYAIHARRKGWSAVKYVAFWRNGGSGGNFTTLSGRDLV